MLCDDVVAHGCSRAGMDVSCILPRVAKAQKFVLGPEFAAVADALATDYTGLVRAFEHCRLPFAETWIEFAHMDRPLFSSAPVQAPVFQKRPRRVGMLLSATREDLSAWKAHLFWTFGDGDCRCPLLAMAFDMTGEYDQAEIPTPEELAALKEERRKRGVLDVDAYTAHPGWQGAAELVRLAMLRHTTVIRADYPLPAFNIPMTPAEGERVAQGMLDLAASDWAGEVSFLLAVIGLLNARNVAEAEPADLGRLNKARAKRGAKPLFEHKVLKIARRRVLRPHEDWSGGGQYEPMRGHFVRGHFKVRRTGIFFWHPHARGDFSRGTIEKDYEL